MADLDGDDIDFSKVRGWLKPSRRPEVSGNGSETCTASTSTPPEQALVLSVDEQTPIQAKQRKHPDQSPIIGRRRRPRVSSTGGLPPEGWLLVDGTSHSPGG